MSAVPASIPLEIYHQQAHENLDRLATLARHIGVEGFDAHARQQAGLIERFFSRMSRQHHVEEETTVFRPLLAGADGDMRTVLDKLRQDHGWIEQNWLELAPKLGALSSGNHWFDPAELQHDMEVFLGLYQEHLELEETRVYPAVMALRAEADSR